MALFIIANSGKISYGIKHYLCDTLDDIPFEDNGEAIAPGSTVYVIDSKKTYMYNSKGQWVEIITGGGSGGASALSGLTDVNLSQLKDGEYLVYDVESGMWKNGTGKDIYAELQGILTAGETTVTLTSDYITANSVIEDYVDDAFDGVEYISREVTDGSVTYTFPEQENDMPVMARVWIKGVGTAGVEIDDDETNLNSTWSSTKIAQESEKKVDKTEFADEYDNSSSYSVGDLTIHNDKYYINITAIPDPGEEFDPTKWQEVSLSDIFTNVNNKMDKSNPTGSGSFSLNRKANTTIGTNSFAEGYDGTASGPISHAEGTNTTASGGASHAEGDSTKAIGNYSHAEGQGTTASGTYSHTEGGGTTASQPCSHAEGGGTTASGTNSHAEGGGATASGANSHAEGANTVASGNQTHAEGNGTKANAENAHAEGDHTIAAGSAQHVSGRYNIADNDNTYVEIVGNGTATNARSNARTLDWQGNEVLAGDLTINGNQSVTQALSKIVIQKTQAEYDLLTTEQKMNGSIYKLTDKAVMLCLDEEYHAVKELTTAQYEALSTAEKNNGTIYIKTDAETTGEDIPVNTLTPNTSINSAINACFGRTGSDIPVATGETKTIAEAIEAVGKVTTGQATLDTTKIDGGGINYTKIGKIVIVDVNVRFKANITTESAICSGLPSGSLIHFLIGVSQNIYRAYFDGTTIKMSDVPPAAYCTGMFVYKAN
jgi:hypothetical protein